MKRKDQLIYEDTLTYDEHKFKKIINKSINKTELILINIDININFY